MIGIRRLVPWIVSLAAHAALLLIPVGIARPPAIDHSAGRRVVMVFDAASAPRSAPRLSLAAAEAALLPPAPPTPAAAIELPRAAALAPPSVPAPATAAGTPATAAAALQAPSPRDVLALLPDAPTPLEVTAAAAAAAADTEIVESTQWSGSPRKLLRRVPPRFPAELGDIGQEVDCDARITVSPRGEVVDVEIVRSSGYTDIDAGVEAALRQYLYSRVEGKQNAVGTVSFRFRLEKRD